MPDDDFGHYDMYHDNGLYPGEDLPALAAEDCRFAPQDDPATSGPAAGGIDALENSAPEQHRQRPSTALADRNTPLTTNADSSTPGRHRRRSPSPVGQIKRSRTSPTVAATAAATARSAVDSSTAARPSINERDKSESDPLPSSLSSYPYSCPRGREVSHPWPSPTGGLHSPSKS
ncbi:unnamed protein product, partial [Sphacelaria rigidula]